jgi:hypothetical protein
MKKLLQLIVWCFVGHTAMAQGTAFSQIHLPAADRGKPVKYNSLGMGAYPYEQLMVGGNYINYRKFGYGVSWRVGINNILLSKRGFSEIIYDTAAKKGFLTGKKDISYSFSANLNFAVALTKKIPLYFGLGIVEVRHHEEIQSPFKTPGETEWQLNPHTTGFKLNFGAGVFIPLFNRVVLNLGYDHLPQTVFVGIAISSPYNYEDIDMW